MRKPFAWPKQPTAQHTSYTSNGHQSKLRKCLTKLNYTAWKTLLICNRIVQIHITAHNLSCLLSAWKFIYIIQGSILTMVKLGRTSYTPDHTKFAFQASSSLGTKPCDRHYIVLNFNLVSFGSALQPSSRPMDGSVCSVFTLP